MLLTDKIPYISQLQFFFQFAERNKTADLIVHHLSIHHPSSVNSGFSESAVWIQAKFCG